MVQPGITPDPALVQAVCDLANAFRVPPTAPAYEPSTPLAELRTRLRYDRLAVPDLAWNLANVLALAELNHADAAGVLREIALQLTQMGHRTDLLTALLAAGHTSKDAIAARDVLA